jgi:hypothetical protein
MSADGISGTYSTVAIPASAPSTYAIVPVLVDPNNKLSNYAITINNGTLSVTQEDARVEYTGQMFSSTPGTANNTALVKLRATVQDITAVLNDPAYDAFAGDITKARVRFVVKDFNNGTVIATSAWVNPAVIVAGDNKTGSAAVDLNVSLGSQSYALYNIDIEVGDATGYYKVINSSAASLTVARPLNDFVTGGGNITPGTGQSRGTYASDAGRKTNFGFNVKYTKGSTTLQGNVNILFRRTVNGVVRVYQIKTTAFNSGGNSFGVGNNPGDPSTTMRSTLVTKANLMDVTNPALPISVAGNLTLQLEMTDRGEPGTADDMAITLYNGSELWYSSNWNVTKTMPLVLTGGNVVVRGTAYGSLSTTTTTPIVAARVAPTTTVLPEPRLDLYPNPSNGRFVVALSNNKAQKATIQIISKNGLVVAQKSVVLTGDLNTTSFDISNLSHGMYIVKIVTADGVQTTKVVVQR